MNPISELYFCETSLLLKLLLLDNSRSCWVDEYFLTRNVNGEFERSFEELSRDKTKFFEYTRMSQSTFFYILKAIENQLQKYSNFRECISPKQKLVLTLR